jgi:hypothetical protein
MPSASASSGAGGGSHDDGMMLRVWLWLHRARLRTVAGQPVLVVRGRLTPARADKLARRWR